MKKILKYIYVSVLVGIFTGCGNLSEPLDGDNDYVRLQLSIAGTYGNPFLPSSREGDEESEQLILNGKYPEKLATGSTLWVLIEELPEDADTESQVTYLDNAIMESFVVDAKYNLQPCEVKDNGEFDKLSNKVLYIRRGKSYRARAIGPARELQKIDSVGYCLKINNNEYVYAHDTRYKQTKQTVFQLAQDYAEDVAEIILNPVIHQTAELKFTIVPEVKTEIIDGEEVKYSPVHQLEVMPAGVVVTGLQNHYEVGPGYNWTLGFNYLKAFPGDVENYMTIYDPIENDDPDELKLVFRAPILPTDAVANPIIVGFYLRVNGVPTQFQMMLNRKMFLHAYYYHYKGTIKITEGITVLEWQTVTREMDVEIPEIIEGTTP